MQDRVSTYPNRWKLTPVAGQTNVYDFERADEPVVAGTPLNKATFLTNETAAAIAMLSGSAPTLPTEALSAIAAILSDLDAGKVAHFEYGSYVGTGNRGSSYPNTLTFTHKPRMVWIVKSADWDAWHWANVANLAFWFYPMTGQRAYSSADDVVTYVYYSMPTDNSLSWYYYRSTGTQANHAERQMNTSGATYYYVALTVD